ncbi:MAG: ATP synthase F1 subunit delta [Bryobacteraceae bacterium]|nr:ATP synthase F1 subunit delta [Bryobacteraceae bacterium]MDW8378788.1 ATP synthase F1 subunit delta [Bryobacterales bacterium]
MSLAIASHYANALADVILGPKSTLAPPKALEQLQAVEEVFHSSRELRHVLSSPAVPMTRKSAVISRLCEWLSLDRVLRNFIHIVVLHRRTALLGQIRSAFEAVLDERMGFVKANVTSAAPLNADAQAALEAQLARLTGKRVRCHYRVDPALIGGVVACIGSKVYDGSVRGQFEALRRRLTA